MRRKDLSFTVAHNYPSLTDSQIFGEYRTIMENNQIHVVTRFSHTCQVTKRSLQKHFSSGCLRRRQMHSYTLVIVMSVRRMPRPISYCLWIFVGQNKIFPCLCWIMKLCGITVFAADSAPHGKWTHYTDTIWYLNHDNTECVYAGTL